MEIEFQGKVWVLASAGEYAGSRGVIAQLTLHAIREAEKAQKGRRQLDYVTWGRTANWLLNGYWETKAGV